jgi:hypothetical protein
LFRVVEGQFHAAVLARQSASVADTLAGDRQAGSAKISSTSRRLSLKT